MLNGNEQVKRNPHNESCAAGSPACRGLKSIFFLKEKGGLLACAVKVAAGKVFDKAIQCGCKPLST